MRLDHLLIVLHFLLAVFFNSLFQPFFSVQVSTVKYIHATVKWYVFLIKKKLTHNPICQRESLSQFLPTLFPTMCFNILISISLPTQYFKSIF
jgi:hypothetical protein